MKKVVLLVTVVLAVCASSCTKEGNKKGSENRNQKRAEKLIDDIFTCVAWVEDEQGETVYWCGARWTGPYGVTVDENGYFFHKGDKVTKSRAKKLVYKHLREQVFPFLRYVERDLKDREIIAVCMFIYNVGGEQFSGHMVDGSLASCQPSAFLMAINKGEKPEKIVNKMTGFRKSAGRRANGLLKRHWVTGAIYLGEISIDEVKSFRPKWFYETRNMGNYYWLDSHRNFQVEGNYYKLRYDETTLSVFHRMNDAKNGQRSVADII